MSDWDKHDSSHIERSRYDPLAQEVHVQFKGNARTYVYAGVPREVYDGFTSADSAGQFFHANIKHSYDFTAK